MVSGNIKAAVKMLGPVAWLAFAAGLQMLGALLFFKAPLDPILISTYTIIAFGIYLLNRFTDKEDSYNCPEQKMFFQRKSTLIAFPIALIILSTLVLAVSNRLVLWHLVLVVSGILYSISIIPFIRNKSLCFIRLKDILFVKNVAVSLLWGIMPFAIAASQKTSTTPQKIELVTIIAAFCLSTLINTTSCDVRDVEGDRHAGAETIPTQFGINFTVFFLLLLGIIGSLFVAANFYLGNIGKAALCLFFATLLWTGIVAAPIYTKGLKLPKVISEPLIDTQQIFCGISLIVFSVCL
jgi:4-hydroxybenzoate polyprenyltransferase